MNVKPTITAESNFQKAVAEGITVSEDDLVVFDVLVDDTPSDKVLTRPTRALRYVKPDEKHRIHTRDIAQRVLQGDTVIVDLRTLVHGPTSR